MSLVNVHLHLLGAVVCLTLLWDVTCDSLMKGEFPKGLDEMMPLVFLCSAVICFWLSAV